MTAFHPRVRPSWCANVVLLLIEATTLGVVGAAARNRGSVGRGEDRLRGLGGRGDLGGGREAGESESDDESADDVLHDGYP